MLLLAITLLPLSSLFGRSKMPSSSTITKRVRTAKRLAAYEAEYIHLGRSASSPGYPMCSDVISVRLREHSRIFSGLKWELEDLTRSELDTWLDKNPILEELAKEVDWLMQKPDPESWSIGFPSIENFQKQEILNIYPNKGNGFHGKTKVLRLTYADTYAVTKEDIDDIKKNERYMAKLGINYIRIDRIHERDLILSSTLAFINDIRYTTDCWAMVTNIEPKKLEDVGLEAYRKISYKGPSGSVSSLLMSPHHNVYAVMDGNKNFDWAPAASIPVGAYLYSGHKGDESILSESRRHGVSENNKLHSIKTPETYVYYVGDSETGKILVHN